LQLVYAERHDPRSQTLPRRVDFPCFVSASHQAFVSVFFIPHLANLRLDTCISIRRTNQTHPRTHTNPQTNFHVNCSLPVISDHQQEIRIRKTAQPTLINSFSCPMKCLMTLTPQQQINHKKSASSRSSSGHFSRAAKPSNAHGALNPEGIFAIPTSPENQ
jgi:hypothetical protein